jgi:hypothetical protein
MTGRGGRRSRITGAAPRGARWLAAMSFTTMHPINSALIETPWLTGRRGTSIVEKSLAF